MEGNILKNFYPIWSAGEPDTNLEMLTHGTFKNTSYEEPN